MTDINRNTTRQLSANSLSNTAPMQDDNELYYPSSLTLNEIVERTDITFDCKVNRLPHNPVLKFVEVYLSNGIKTAHYSDMYLDE